MIDVTDGLASDLMQICKASGRGCRVYYSRIPVDYETARLAGEFNIDPVVAALNGGDDFEFLFTLPPAMHEKVLALKTVRVIGHMTDSESGMNLMGDDGSELALTAQGWK
jgi:thiamine-monophosphate kinase